MGYSGPGKNLTMWELLHQSGRYISRGFRKYLLTASRNFDVS